MNWVEYSEQRPIEYQWVIAWDAEVNVPQLIHYNEGGWSRGFVPHGRLTHWVSLPDMIGKGPPPSCCKTCGKPLITPDREAGAL
jgi:hypothetical protein